MTAKKPPSGHAVVVGASMAGLLAARVLSQTYATVTVLDRDQLPSSPETRRSVPQASHAPGLLARGRQILEELFPGLTDELVTRYGAVAGDIQRDAAWHNDGHAVKRDFADMLCLVVSRPLLEWYVRSRVEALPNVMIQGQTEVLGLVATRKQVTGVRTLRSGAAPSPDDSLSADLVVDATGRTNRGSAWLKELGYPAPAEEKLDSELVYVSATFARKPDEVDPIAIVVGATVANPRGGVALAVDGDRWMTTLLSTGVAEAPTDPESYVEWTAQAPNPGLYQLLAGLPIVERPHRMCVPPSVWRRFDRLRRRPGQFVAVGDSLCAFNPAYAQGMTSAAEQALALRACLAQGRRNLPARFYARASKIISIAWTVSVTADLRFPHLKGERTRAVRFLNWYISRIHRVAARDGSVGRAFLRVANLVDPPQALFAPALFAKALRG